MGNSDLKALLKRAIELVMPDLRSYYRVVRKARVEKTYDSDGRYWADVQLLRNDENVDETEPIIPKVEIPILWAGPSRGVVCPPVVGAHCDLEYYDGDPNYPRISNFRWYKHGAPAVDEDEFIIQQGPGTHIWIDKDGCIEHRTGADLRQEVGRDKTETIGGKSKETVTQGYEVGAESVSLQAAGGGLAIDKEGNAEERLSGDKREDIEKNAEIKVGESFACEVKEMSQRGAVGGTVVWVAGQDDIVFDEEDIGPDKNDRAGSILVVKPLRLKENVDILESGLDTRREGPGIIITIDDEDAEMRVIAGYWRYTKGDDDTVGGWEEIGGNRPKIKIKADVDIDGALTVKEAAVVTE